MGYSEDAFQRSHHEMCAVRPLDPVIPAGQAIGKSCEECRDGEYGNTCFKGFKMQIKAPSLVRLARSGKLHESMSEHIECLRGWRIPAGNEA